MKNIIFSTIRKISTGHSNSIDPTSEILTMVVVYFTLHAHIPSNINISVLSAQLAKREIQIFPFQRFF